MLLTYVSFWPIQHHLALPSAYVNVGFADQAWYNCHFWQPLRLCWANLRSRFPPAFSLPISVLPSLLSSNIALLVSSASGLLFGCSICPCFSYACCLRFGCFVFAFFFVLWLFLLLYPLRLIIAEFTGSGGGGWIDVPARKSLAWYICHFCYVLLYMLHLFNLLHVVRVSFDDRAWWRVNFADRVINFAFVCINFVDRAWWCFNFVDGAVDFSCVLVCVNFADRAWSCVNFVDGAINFAFVCFNSTIPAWSCANFVNGAVNFAYVSCQVCRLG